MENRSGGGSNNRNKSKSILFKPRPPKDFIELLRSSTEFSYRTKRDGSKEPQARIGTSFRNSIAVPTKYLEVLYEHLGEVLEERDAMVERLEEENHKREDAAE